MSQRNNFVLNLPIVSRVTIVSLCICICTHPAPASETAGGGDDDEDDDDAAALSKEEIAKLQPQTPMEVRLATVWRELFAKSRILINDDFFELGASGRVDCESIATAQRRA